MLWRTVAWHECNRSGLSVGSATSWPSSPPLQRRASSAAPSDAPSARPCSCARGPRECEPATPRHIGAPRRQFRDVAGTTVAPQWRFPWRHGVVLDCKLAAGGRLYTRWPVVDARWQTRSCGSLPTRLHTSIVMWHGRARLGTWRGCRHSPWRGQLLALWCCKPQGQTKTHTSSRARRQHHPARTFRIWQSADRGQGAIKQRPELV